ncbi:hypothetical protein Tco_0029477 [Tanacetum coccineum]
MSDSEDSIVTYTEIPSPYEDLSDIGSQGAEGPIFQDPPSPDYVPGPKEPEQAPPSPIYVPFVPEPVYPEFLPEDDVLPAEEQPLPIAASPTTESPGYIPESDPVEDPAFWGFSSMSDSEDSTVTYTEIPSPYEDLSDIGSQGAEGPIFQDPPSPDYVPGPEEPEQAPPSPIYVPFVPEPVYPEFLPEDDVLPAEEQLLHEDPADYPADRGDDKDDEEPSNDDDDDDDAEEEHLAPADPAAIAYSAD